MKKGKIRRIISIVTIFFNPILSIISNNLKVLSLTSGEINGSVLLFKDITVLSISKYLSLIISLINSSSSITFIGLIGTILIGAKKQYPQLIVHPIYELIE